MSAKRRERKRGRGAPVKRGAGTPTAKPRFVLLPAVLLAVAAAFILLPGGAAKAQTPASAVTEAPVVTARAAGAHAVDLSWNAGRSTVRKETV